ncbi:penicillin-binding protein activator LpoB [Pseudomonas sp. TKO26]|uniref:penicillin-binding protein activator LpoB n=1 Tax=unclassified Pseudomonas TaxID=196821 RepID=UPI000D9DED7B|nr:MULTISPECIES: penicillin-binding protein activator LpoB [unclassified Pseudomonas]PYY79496.1 penicillin-binding protein activator LpoB [Pseudomonas sp. TKO29]PYY84136.1 penicillin-binding protein activator LpoB [Pseudomonas sp. TKO30]PYY88446.1 penicillin-binding protein activator LpoB [Pseudomonas sp. TKO26]PYY98737.1 penicillin-binding protein activator LpoB [Pseudomonas sp. TKO14]
MQSLRCVSLAMAALLMAGCTSFTGQSSPELSKNARWGVLPLVNYSQTPQAGERSEQILLSVLSSRGLQPQVYSGAPGQGEPALLDDSERLAGAMDWAREQKLDYVVSGSVEEWQYKNGLDGEPAVGISLRVVEASTGKVLWSHSGARAGWSRESLAGAAQKVLDKLVGGLRIE